MKIPERINDAYFARVNTDPEKDDDGMIKPETKVDKEWLEKRKADQKEVDTQILAKVKETEHLDMYLRAKFSLTKGQAPHAMVF